MPSRVAVVSEQQCVTARVVEVLQRDPAFAPFALSPVLARRSLNGARPHLVVLDYGFGESLGLCDAFSDGGCLGTVVIDVPEHLDADIDVLLAGARGIVYAKEGYAPIARASHVVADGQVWAPRRVVADAWQRMKREFDARQAGDATLSARLSARERQVFHFAASGLGNKEVATRLSISEATVKVHLSHIFQKLGLRGRGELAAAYHGIIRQSYS